MSHELAPSSFIVITLVMLFISGCWTIASSIPYAVSYALRVGMMAMVTASNISFLISLLTSVLSYASMSQERRMKKIGVASFSIGVVALVISVTLFAVSYIVTAPRYYPD